MEFFIAILLVLAGGICEGLFSLGVMRTPKWQWENIWGLGSLVALVLVPWPVAWLTVPNLMEVFQSVSPSVLLTTFLFGLGWGLGGIFWGKAIAAVGVALGVSLLMGLTTVFGSPVPLAIQDPEALATPGGLTLLAALAVMVVGVVVCALAGRQKDIELREAQDPNSQASKATPFAIGLLFCVISGMLSAMVNFGLVFGQPIAEAASNAGATAASKNNALWAVVFTGNYLVNVVYAGSLMIKNRTLGRIVSHGDLTHWFWALFMGITWPLGIVLFGIGAENMGRYGPFIAFPMMLLCAILTGNLAGALTGEWRNTSSKPRTTMAIGIAILCIAFAIFGAAHMLLS